MIGLLLPLVAAHAGRDAPDEGAELARDDRSGGLVPVHLEGRVPFRQDLRPGATVGLGVELAHRGRSSVDLDVSYTSGRLLLLGGMFRSLEAGDAVLETDTRLSRWLGFGAVGGVGLRNFRQQNNDIDQQFVPLAGLRVESAVLWSRWWSLAVVGRGTADLMLTRLVLETQRVVWMSPYEGQLGLRLVVGSRAGAR